ncbi:Gmad2 immunoglobulin-like domain-containing protein [Intrasporangium sp. DVR]|uniref:Gmad2 immunoglobulin-like domain-containing protein n=1 Tax=Intrasporangium sp. DVR TaxID=3127867 RepID=UPI00313A64FB
MNPDDSRRRSRHEDETVVIGVNFTDIEATLRTTLADDARSIEPRERLEAVLSQAHSAPVAGARTPRRWLVLAAAAAVALVAGGTLWLAGRPTALVPVPAGTTTSTSTPTTSPSPSSPSSTASPPTSSAPPSPSGASASTTAAPAGSIKGVPVYWIGETGGAPRLFREFRTVPDEGGPILSALYAMTREQPLDPDYVTPWAPASRITVALSGSALVVDLDGDAISATKVGSQVAERAVQQLVYTATAAAAIAKTPVSTVTVLVEGGPADLWGVVRVGRPTARAPQVEVQSHVWVLAPAEGQDFDTGRVTFRGYGTSFEANFRWQIARADGSVVAEGNAMAGTGTGGFGEFEFERTLPPGDYVVTMSTDDPSGGAEGGGAQVDTKTFTVR